MADVSAETESNGVVHELDTKSGVWKVRPTRYRHYKGGEYEFVCEAILESNPEVKMIVYRSADGSIWTRPSDVFFAQVEHEGNTVQRFERIEC